MIKSTTAIAIGITPITKDLNILFPNFGRMGEVKVVNASPNPAIVTIGSDSHWIDSWNADVFCLRDAFSLTIDPKPLITGPTSTVNSQAAVLLSVASNPGETPGVYPSAVQRPFQVMQPPKRIANNIAGGIANATKILPIPTTGGAYLWSVTLTIDVAGAAGNAFRLYDGDPNNGGTEMAEGSQAMTGPFLFEFYGSPLVAAGVNGLWMYTDVQTFNRGTIAYALG